MEQPNMRGTILAVDDEYANRFLLENILVEYRVICAANSKELWHILESDKIDLILLDIMMPGEDGFTMAAKLARNEQWRDIPIIFVTAKDSGEDVKRGFHLGGSDYVKKPFDEIELKARIEAVLQQKQRERKLRMDSITDPLTGLYNRKYFADTATKQIEYIKRYAKEMSIAILDIDHFKRINDSYGHPAGDLILKEFATLLQQQIRSYDLLARYGGEEFVVMFLECDKHLAKRILDRIRSSVESRTFLFEKQVIQLAFSGGVAAMKDLVDIPPILDELLRIADKRLYIAKFTGRNKIVDEG
jgi:diguanylate cyclase (GGDEF)-like protein